MSRPATKLPKNKAAKKAPKKAPKRSKRLPPELVEAMFSRFRSANPEPRGELNSVNPFTFLVAVVLSAQATDEGVNRATGPLFQVADTPEKMLALGEEAHRLYQDHRSLPRQGEERDRAVAPAGGEARLGRAP